MRRVIAKVALRAARKNPRATLGVVLFGARHSKAIAKTLKTTRRASRAVDRARLAQPEVRRELRASAASLGDTIARVRKVGLAEAVSDKQTAKHLQRALRHASEAASRSRAPRRRHYLRTGLAFLMLPLVAGYGAWRLKSRD